MGEGRSQGRGKVVMVVVLVNYGYTGHAVNQVEDLRFAEDLRFEKELVYL